MPRYPHHICFSHGTLAALKTPPPRQFVPPPQRGGLRKKENPSDPSSPSPLLHGMQLLRPVREGTGAALRAMPLLPVHANPPLHLLLGSLPRPLGRPVRPVRPLPVPVPVPGAVAPVPVPVPVPVPAIMAVGASVDKVCSPLLRMPAFSGCILFEKPGFSV